MSEARAALRQLYADFDAELASHGPRCELSGRCCRFGEWEHDLFVTELELAELVAVHGPPPRAIDDPGDPARSCPYQQDKLCGAHDARPLGCRSYYCDPEFATAMPALAEDFHSRLRALHAEHDIPYRYGELLRMLAEGVG